MTGPSDPVLAPFLAARRDALAFDLAYAAPFAPWQARLRQVWQGSLPPHAGPPAAEILAEEPRGDLRLTRLRFTYATGAQGEAALLRPTGPVRKAVLLLHDHGGSFDQGWRKMIADGVPPAPFYDGRHLGDALARQGHAVLCADAFGWGSRQYGGYERQQAVASHALQLGWSLAGIVAAEDLQALCWLAGQGFGPVATFGFSFGGYRAWQAAALSPLADACVALSWIGRRKAMLRDGNPGLRGQSAFYMLHPALAARADHPDLAGLACDRPLFMRLGRDDRHCPPAAGAPALADLARIAADAGGRFDGALFDGGHCCPVAVQDRALAFLSRHL